MQTASLGNAESSRFLGGLYQGLGSAGVPVVGVEPARVEQSAIPVFQRYRLSTVDSVETPVGASLRCSCSRTPTRPATTASATPPIGSCRRSSRRAPGEQRVEHTEIVTAPAAALTILIAARDEEARIGTTVAELRRQFPGARGGGRRRRLARRDRRGGRGGPARPWFGSPRRGKGQALTLGERAASEGDLLLCDADLRGDLRPLLSGDADLTVAAFARKQGGGFGIAKAGRPAADPTQVGLRRDGAALGPATADAEDPRRGFPPRRRLRLETAMTADASRAGLTVAETEVELEHRATGRDLGGFLHRGRQLRDILLAFGPQGENHRGLRLPLVGWTSP